MFAETLAMFTHAENSLSPVGTSLEPLAAANIFVAKRAAGPGNRLKA